MFKLADPTPPPSDPHAGHHGGMEMPAASDPGPVGQVVGFDDLASWQPSAGWLVAIVVLGIAYAVGVALLRSGGIHWPIGRTVGWFLGLLTMLATTCTGVGQLGMVLFSVHMAQHMVLSMLTPILLLLGAPITLALRALPARSAVRRGVLTVLHSRLARLMSYPGVTVPTFVVSLFGLYFTGLFDLAMSSHVGHHLMLIHFLLVGLLFFGPILRVDPWPRRTAPGLRLVEMLIAVPFHAFFGVIVMQAAAPLSATMAESAYRLGVDPLADQATGGGVAWGFGEAPIVLVTLVVFVQWLRSDRREAARLDRQAARDGDAALAAYNAKLQLLHESSSAR
ncbi:putative copper resistance protein D [Kribbella sp. VKM Ac-2527]|uniref:Putative copper resistance protein D n=1 Tax=Kribbella caucasensis TaxID=2512215 RepID=A0A4R6KDC2_9ACTN|nr:cytochrome c oxidase assembly protein [Kribbella sp. VKM Ac-2527]TDO48461.1 putative copper resistance protein D [Kribbella sp. VKM Ac-2527]